MNVQVNVVLDLSPNFEKLLSALINNQPEPVLVPAAQTVPVETTKSTKQATKTQKTENLDADTGTGAEVVSLETLRAIAKNKDREVVRSLLDAFGFASISVLPEDKRTEFKTKLEAA